MVSFSSAAWEEAEVALPTVAAHARMPACSPPRKPPPFLPPYDTFVPFPYPSSAGTAPWLTQGVGAPGSNGARAAAAAQSRPAQAAVSSTLPACTWSALMANTYLKGCDALNCASYATLAAAQGACIADAECGGVTSSSGGAAPWEVRSRYVVGGLVKSAGRAGRLQQRARGAESSPECAETLLAPSSSPPHPSLQQRARRLAQWRGELHHF